MDSAAEKDRTGSTEGDFIRFWRSVWQGVPPDRGGGRLAMLGEQTLALASRDMTRACLDFLLRQGGTRVRHRLVFPNGPTGRPQRGDGVLGDASSAPLLGFCWSKPLLEWMLHVFQGHTGLPTGLQASNASALPVSEGILITLLLHRLGSGGEHVAPLARLPVFDPDMMRQLLCLAPFAQVFFFDLLPEDAPPFDLAHETAPEFFLEAFSALIPYAVDRWLAIEAEIVRTNTDAARLTHLCRRRGEIARQLAELARTYNRHDVMEFHARLTERGFASPFYEVNRGLMSCLQVFTEHTGRLLEQGNRVPGSIGLARFYRECRPSRSDSRVPVPDNVLDSFPVDALCERAHLLTACDLWSDPAALRVAELEQDALRHVIERHLRENGLDDGTAVSEAMANGLADTARRWLLHRLCDATEPLRHTLEERYEVLDRTAREAFKDAFSHLAPDDRTGATRLLEQVVDWLALRRVRRWVEHTLALEGGHTRESHPWRERHEAEQEAEAELLGRLNDPRHDVCAWLDAWLVRLGDHEAFGSLTLDIREGYAFAAEWIIAWQWRRTIDRWDEQEMMTSDLLARVAAEACFPATRTDIPANRFGGLLAVLSQEVAVARDTPYWARAREIVEAAEWRPPAERRPT